MTFYQKHLFFCVNQKEGSAKCCQNAGANAMFLYTRDRLRALDLFGPDKIRVSHSGCLGRCGSGPSLVVYPDNIWYSYQSTADIDEIIEKHLIGQDPVERLLMKA